MAAKAQLNFVVDVFRDQRHFLDDLLLVIKLGKAALQFAVELFAGRLAALSRVGFAAAVLPLGVASHPLLIQFAHFLTNWRNAFRCLSRPSIFLSRMTRSKRSLGGSEISFSARAMCSLPANPKL